MKPSELKEGDKVFFIDWNSYTFEIKQSICQIKKVCNGSCSWRKDHIDIKLYSIIGDYSNYTLYSKLDLNKIYVEIYPFDLEYNYTFITCNDRLYTDLLYQLIYNKTYDSSLIKRVLYYD